MATTDEFIAAGLYDPDGPEVGRLEMLEWLAAQGFTVEQMLQGEAQLSLGSMAGDRRLFGHDRISREEAMEIAGIDAARFEGLATAFGFTQLDPVPGAAEGVSTTEEALTFELLEEIAAIFSEDEVLGLARVLGSSLGRIAEACVSMFLTDVESDLLTSGASELELATSVYDAIGLLDGLSERLDPVLRRHVLQAVQRSRRAMINETERFVYRYAIGFVDLVGFTEISGHLDPRALAAFIGDFEGRTHDVVTKEGARIVKLIGDEIMFAATDPDAACRAASALMVGFGNEHERVLPRGGLAYGDVLSRGGDFYGSVVNLASRLVDEAVPQEVLVTEDLATAASASHFEPAGRRMVKGFDDPVVVHSLASG